MLNMLAMLLVGTYAQGDAPAVDRVKYCSPHSEQDLRLHGFEIEIPRAEREPDPLAGGPNVTTVLDNGDPDNRVDLVFVGDGFTEADLANWPNLVVQGYERLFDYEPFQRYQAFFNVHQVDVISPESGVDNDPTEGVDRNTALDMGFFCANIERLLCVDVNKAEAQAAFAPDVDQIVAVANSSKYGGAGYSSSNLGTYSGFNQVSVEVFIHELGHSLGDLADEYDYGGGSVYEGDEFSQANATILDESAMNGSGLKWDDWIGSDLAGVGNHSCFEGCSYAEFGAYRPSENSMMRSLEQPFNSPSREQLIRKIYEEVSLIDGVEPASGSVPATGTLQVFHPMVEGEDLEVTWWLDGILIGGASDELLELSSLDVTGADTLMVQIRDLTSMVRDEDLRDALMTDSYSWTIEGQNPDLNGDGVVDGTDLSLVLGFWGTDSAVADINHDGLVNGIDLSIVLGFWG